MRYRAEIDGLRAVAVIPVILFHAGFGLFRGGFVGVDVFFVISGFLITNIILSDLQANRFSLVMFYERRARRLLPMLFLIMALCSVFSYAWMLPDELENFGQSLIATALSSHNVLLALTSGYWALASEFKPLLHTWSLAVEEQYYIVFPLFLMLAWNRFRRHITAVLVLFFFASLAAAHWGAFHEPTPAFYLLPTRGWEILFGSFIALHNHKSGDVRLVPRFSQALSLLGLVLIGLSLLTFSSETPSPSLFTLVPTAGVALIILFATEGTVAHRILSHQSLVAVGLISYSAYLWHFPLFAFARIYSPYQPSQWMMALLSAVTFPLAWLTWRYVERPLRERGRVSRSVIFGASAIASLCFVGFGYHLHRSHGVPGRLYDAGISANNELYIAYNERAHQFTKDAFAGTDDVHLLITGNSFARDFINMTLETFDLSGVELVYLPDLRDCIFPFKSREHEALYTSSDVVVFASGAADVECVRENIERAQHDGKKIFYVGTKHFGYNLNWLTRLAPVERPNKFNPLPTETASQEEKLSRLVPKEHFIPLLAPILEGDQVPITDSLGRLISADRMHLTKFGAIYVGKKALLGTAYEDIFSHPVSQQN